MTKPRKLFLFAALLTWVAGAGASRAMTVTSDLHGESDVASYRTWAWRTGGPALDPLVEAHIRAAVEDRLADKGYEKADGDGEADFHVVSQARKNGRYLFGQLRLDLYDAASGELVYSALAADAAPESLKRARKLIDRAVRRMLKELPQRTGE